MTRTRPAPRPGFSLIEILISILILALGLLGLAALFPVVIREQRSSVDQTNASFLVRRAAEMLNDVRWESGIPTAASPKNPFVDNRRLALAYLLDSQSVVKTPAYPIQPVAGDPVKGLGEGYEGPQQSPPATRRFQPFEYGQWYTRTVIDGVNPVGNEARQIGDAVLGLRTSATITTPSNVSVAPDRTYMRIPLTERVFPSSGDPQLVWDFALQRVPLFSPLAEQNPPTSNSLRAAIFVRRVDPRIRTGAETLRGAFFNSAAATTERRVPLGERAPSAGWLSYSPTLDGTDGAGGVRYCGVKGVGVEFVYDPGNASLNHRDRLYLATSTTDARWNPTGADLKLVYELLRQPGQKIVDNLGNVYSVVGSGSEPAAAGLGQDCTGDGVPDYLVIDPPVPTSVTPSMARNNSAVPQVTGYTPGTPAERERRAIWQVAFTPQVPVAVEVVEVKK